MGLYIPFVLLFMIHKRSRIIISYCQFQMMCGKASSLRMNGATVPIATKSIFGF